MSDWLRSLAILGAAVAGMAGVTLVITGLVVPGSAATALPTATPEPSFDLAIAPDRVGGSLVVSGDRTGVLALEGSSSPFTFVVIDDRYPTLSPGQTTLTGPDGKVIIDRDPAHVRQIDYDGLSFYLDPPDCAITSGASDIATGLMVVQLECSDIADVRDNGVISLSGVIGIPLDALGDRGSLPPSGGSINVGETSIEFDNAVAQVGEPVEVGSETRQVPFWASDDSNSILNLDYSSETAAFTLGAVAVVEGYAIPAQSCPVASETLGKLNPTTTVVRLTLDCPAVDHPALGSVSVTGSIVADLVEEPISFVPGG